MTLVAGIDSSTQSTKVLLCDAADGQIVASGQAPHPAGTECDPHAWWQALQQAGDGLLERACAVSVAAQQHGMVALDGDDEVVRDALLWNDTRSARQTHDLIAEGGGAQGWARNVGSLPTVSFTITKLRWLAEAEPDNAARVATVMLPHDWITWKLRGGAVPAAEATTDRGDASGTGYWSAAAESYRPDLLRLALGHDAVVPRVAAPHETVGHTPAGAVLGPGTGDNAAAALGLGMSPGDVAVSIGTSGTAFGPGDVAAADPSGDVAGFADATGRHLPLVCTLNAARVLDTIAETLDCGHDELAELALSAPSGAGGLAFLPYLDGERTPHRPTASGVMSGLTTAAMNRPNLARATVEGMLCGLADALEALGEQGLRADTVHLIGGGAASAAVRQIAPAVFGTTVNVPQPAEYVALGAARQAAWALAGTAQPPQWPQAPRQQYEASFDAQLRQRYTVLRDETAGWRAHR